MDQNLHAGHRERLRAQYLNTGAASFTDHQLLEFLLTFTIPRKNTNELAHRLLNSFGSLENIFFSDERQLMSVAGIGEVSACFLRLMGDVHRRIQIRTLEDNGKLYLNMPLNGARYAFALLSKEPYENVYLISLNKNNVVINTCRIASGTLTTTPIYPRLVAEAALASRAHSVILAHNHPSGDPTPSQDDMDVTELIAKTLRGLDIALFDHIIVGRNSVYSLKAGDIVLTAEEVYRVMRINERGARNEYKDDFSFPDWNLPPAERPY